MKLTGVEKKEKSTVELTIQVDQAAFEAAVQAAYFKKRGTISVPGFRKGKAPRKIIESMYGAGVFYEEAINAVTPEAYEQAVKEQGLDDVGYPKLEIVEVGGEGLTFKALVSVRPQVTLNEYKGIKAPMETVKITDDDIDAELKTYIDRATRLVSVTRKAKVGDTAIIDFEGFDNGVPFEGGKGENHELRLGSGSFVPGFEEQVVGMKAGEQRDVNITFPEDYVPDLAGKSVLFKVTLKEVKEPQAPEVDDEFAKDVSEFETIAAFRKDLEEKLAQRKQAQAKSDFDNAVMEKLVASMECEIPDGMVDVQLDKLMDDYAMRLSGQGMSMDDYIQAMGMTPQMMRSSARPAALRQVQMELALTAVAQAEAMTITDEDVDAELARIAQQHNLTVAQIKAAIPVDDLKKDMLLKRAGDFVVAEAKVEKAKKTAEKAPKSDETSPKSDEASQEEEKPKRTRKTTKKAETPTAE